MPTVAYNLLTNRAGVPGNNTTNTVAYHSLAFEPQFQRNARRILKHVYEFKSHLSTVKMRFAPRVRALTARQAVKQRSRMGRNAFMDGDIGQDSARLPARIAGFAYLITIACGIFAEVVVRGTLVLPGDPAATARNILGAEQLYRLGFAADIVGLVSYVAVTALLYELLAPVNKSLSLLAAFFSLVGITTLAIGSLGHIAALLLLQSPSEMATHSSAQLQATALFNLRIHGQAYNLSDVFFGVYCLVIGWLTAKSTFLPWVIGILLMFAGACYLTDSFATILAPRFERAISDYILLPGLVGEGGLTLWLIVFGIDQSKWRSGG